MAGLIPWHWARAGGRRRYNKQRQLHAAARRRRLLDMLVATDVSQAEAARRMGVDRATICRDVAWLGDLPRQVRDLPGGTVKIGPKGWTFNYSAAAWRNTFPGPSLRALAARWAAP